MVTACSASLPLSSLVKEMFHFPLATLFYIVYVRGEGDSPDSNWGFINFGASRPGGGVTSCVTSLLRVLVDQGERAPHSVHRQART